MAVDREAALQRLLGETGFERAERLPIAGDASTRRYERLIAGARRAVLMDAPHNAEAPPCPPKATAEERRALGWNALSRLAASRVEAFAAVAAQLAQWGLSAPQIHGVDVAAGYAVVEDLGDDLFARIIPHAADEMELYGAAAELLARVHVLEPPFAMPAPGGTSWPLLDYDALALEVNVDLFVEWLPQASDVRIDDAARARWEGVRDGVIQQAMSFPRVFTIRDYHAENLIWLPKRRGLQRIGLLDFQDAVRGWRAWDFSMLLHDARRDVSPTAAEAAIYTYLKHSGALEAGFRHELAVMGALNSLRILGVFARLTARDGKPRYLAFMPRMWGHLARTLKHPALSDMAAFVDEVAGAHLKAAA